FGRHRVELFTASAGDDHMRAERGEFVRHATADSAAATGDEMHRAGEAAVAQNAPIAHGPPPVSTLNHVDVNVNAQLYHADRHGRPHNDLFPSQCRDRLATQPTRIEDEHP